MLIIHTVNNRHPYLPRFLEKRLLQALKVSPIVVLTGARQTGKSTLLQHLPEKTKRAYATLDDLETLAMARQQPDALVNQAQPLALDEVQRTPSLLLAVKRAVDKNRAAGQFLLTGSANILLFKRVNETLAGRAVYLSLLPLTRRELRGDASTGMWSDFFSTPPARWLDLISGTALPKAEWKDIVRKGGYPVPSLQMKTDEERSLWFGGYTQSYLERDIQDIGGISSLVDLRRLMRAICLRLGGIINQSEIARDIGLSQPTVHRHLDVLEASYQLVRLPAYTVNRTKRLIKAQKGYWTDAALATHLAGEQEPRSCHFENLVLNDILAWRGAIAGPEVMYWRTTTGEEVDLVLEHEGKLLPIEIKSTSQPKFSDARHLLTFREEYKKTCLSGLLIHTGNETRWILDSVLSVPWWKIM